MKKVKYILYGIVALIVLLLIAALFLPKRYDFQTSHKVEAPKTVVYNLLSNLSSRVQWDPNMNVEGINIDDRSNQKTLTWLRGEEQIKIEAEKDQNTSDLILNRYQGKSEIPDIIKYVIKEKENNVTDVSIDYKGTSSWPMNLFNFITKRKKAKTLQMEVAAINKIAKERNESNLYNGYKVTEDIVKEKNFITKRDEIAKSAMQQFYVQNMGILFKEVQDAGLEMDLGMSCALFYSEIGSTETIDMAAAIPVTEDVNIANATSEFLKTRMAVVVDYYGDYNNTIEAHDAIKAYFDDHGYIADIPVIEEYITDPTKEKDPSKWLTKITYYIVGQ